MRRASLLAVPLLLTAALAAQPMHWETSDLVFRRTDLGSGSACTPYLQLCGQEVARSHALGRPANIFTVSGFTHNTYGGQPCTYGYVRPDGTSPAGHDVFQVQVRWGANLVGNFQVVLPSGACGTVTTETHCRVVVLFDQTNPVHPFSLAATCSTGAIARKLGSGASATTRFEEGPAHALGSALIDLGQVSSPIEFAGGLLALPVPSIVALPASLDAGGASTVATPEIAGLTYFAQGVFLTSTNPLRLATSGVVVIRG